MLRELLIIAFYGSLALGALWATRHDQDLIWVGGWLVAGWAMSNFIWALGDPSAKPGPYSLIEAMVALAAVVAFDRHRYRALLIIVSLNILSICANLAFASIIKADERQVFLHAVTTNLIFAAECLLAIGIGVAHGHRIGRFDWVPGVRRRLVGALARSGDQKP